MEKKYPTILKLPQRDINRQLYEMILTKSSDSAISRLDRRVEAAERSLGVLAGLTNTLKDIIGNEEIKTSAMGRIQRIEARLGDDETPGTLVYRMRAQDGKSEPKPDSLKSKEESETKEPENKGTETKEPETKKE